MFFIVLGVVIVAFVGVVAISSVFMSNTTRKRPVDNSDFAKKTRMYTFLSENFLTRKTFRKIVEQIASLSIYNLLEIRALAIKYYTQTMGACIGFVLVGAFVFKDITMVLMCTVYAVVVFNALIVKKTDNTHFVVLKEFSYTLASIREIYTVVGNIPDAINECSKGKHLQKTLDRIYLILTATDAEDRLEDFYRTTPFPMLQTLAGVCYLLSDAGDEKDDHGTSAFRSAVTLLKNECDAEVRKYEEQRILFKSLEYLPLAPLPFIGVLEWFFSSYLPGTLSIYNGFVGRCIKLLIVGISLGCYWYITSITSPTALRRNDRNSYVDALLYWRPFRNFLPNILPKKASTKAAVDKLLRGALSNKDIKYLYASKVMTSVLACVLSFFLLNIYTVMAAQYTYDNINTTSLMANKQMTVTEDRLWHELDNSLMDQPRAPRERDLQDIIPAYFPGISAMDLKDQCNRIIEKYNTYHALRYHWWYVPVAFVLGVAGWFVPDLMIYKRKKLVHIEEEEDVLQLQTMLAILRFTQLDTMKALYWLARQSRIYRTAISFAYHEYPSDPELAIDRLKDKSGLPEFQQICERLSTTISQVTIREAFDGLEADRDHMLRVREMIQSNTTKRKRKACSPVSTAPIWATVIGLVVYPIVMLVINQGRILLPQLGIKL